MSIQFPTMFVNCQPVRMSRRFTFFSAALVGQLSFISLYNINYRMLADCLLGTTNLPFCKFADHEMKGIVYGSGYPIVTTRGRVDSQVFGACV